MKVQKDGFMQGEENERYESRDRDKNTSDWLLCGEPGADASIRRSRPSGPAGIMRKQGTGILSEHRCNFDNIPMEFEAYYNDHVPFKNLFVKGEDKAGSGAFK